MMSNNIISQTRFLIVALYVLSVGFVSCRAPFSIEDTDTEMGTDEDTDTFPDPAPGGGCPSDYSDQFDNSGSPYLGGEQEVLVEVSMSTDFHCPYCMMLAMELNGFFDDPDHLNYVRMYYHHYPLPQHPDSMDVHKATVATYNQSMEKFWILHDEVFSRESMDVRMTIEEIIEFADTVLELDMDQFESDRTSEETDDFIAFDKEQASAQGLTGTPSVWVCGIKISWGDLDEVVDYFLAGPVD